jgi:hypothetical protein
MSTHGLQNEEGRTSQNMERKPAREGYSRAGEHREMDYSGHGRQAREREALTPWRAQGDGLVRTWRESGRTTGTHSLESAEGWANQDVERKRARDRHSHTAERRGMD